MKHTWIKLLVVAASLLIVPVTQAAEEVRLKPFVLASQGPGDMNAVVTDVKSKLTANGFEVVGEYSPYADATVVVVTNDALKQNAAKSEHGGYGAAQRVSVTKAKGGIQVAYTNPVYMAHVYRLKGDNAAIAAQLEKALGRKQAFGSDKGLTLKKLGKYHYKFMMPYFDDPRKVAEHSSYDIAVKKVEDGLVAGKFGVTKVYRIDIPGKKETVFGVALKAGPKGDKDMDDTFIMSEIDFKDIKSTAHLPYDVLVSDNRVYILPAEFRIAINFPDLSMMGDNSFMRIMGAPDAIEKAVAKTAGTSYVYD